jgi:hypothetical protein
VPTSCCSWPSPADSPIAVAAKTRIMLPATATITRAHVTVTPPEHLAGTSSRYKHAVTRILSGRMYDAQHVRFDGNSTRSLCIRYVNSAGCLLTGTADFTAVADLGAAPWLDRQKPRLVTLTVLATGPADHPAGRELGVGIRLPSPLSSSMGDGLSSGAHRSCSPPGRSVHLTSCDSRRAERSIQAATLRPGRVQSHQAIR